MARKLGGAVAIQGLEGSTFEVESSVFSANAVRVPDDGSTVDVTLLLATGGIGLGTGIAHDV